MAIIKGTRKSDKLIGTAKADIIFGDAGDDIIRGKGGNDRLIGSYGNDKIKGGSGKDIIAGGADDAVVDVGGNPDEGYVFAYFTNVGDLLWGGGGRDVFQFSRGSGVDVIMDFKPGVDKIDLSDDLMRKQKIVFQGETHLDEYDGPNTTIVFWDGNKILEDFIVLNGVSPDQTIDFI